MNLDPPEQSVITIQTGWEVLVEKSFRAVHRTVFLFLMFGWVLPWEQILNTHLIFLPLVIFHWQLNEGSCFLTNLENRVLLRGISRQRAQGQFIKSLLRSCFDELPPDSTVKKWLYCSLYSSWTLSALRICAFHWRS